MNIPDKEFAELLQRIEDLEGGACRFNCRTRKAAFMAGFDAGATDAVDAGQIICPDYYRDITEKAYKEWKNK
jgi:hypothetical protein